MGWIYKYDVRFYYTIIYRILRSFVFEAIAYLSSASISILEFNFVEELQTIGRYKQSIKAKNGI